MGTPSNIIWHGISKLCAQFHAFITLVTIRSLSHLTIRQLSLLRAPIQSRCQLFLQSQDCDPGNLIGQLEKRFLEGLLLVRFATILTKPVLQSFP